MRLAMAKVWAEKGRGAGFGGLSKRAAARQAKYAYQRKEMELEDEREVLARLHGQLREQKELLARSESAMRKKRLELMRMEDEGRESLRAVQDAEAKVEGQKVKVSRLEHETEQLREQAFRGQDFVM